MNLPSKLFYFDYQRVNFVNSHHGILLRNYLDKNGISAEELAKKMGRSKVTIYNWIARNELSPVQLFELKRFGVDLGVELILTSAKDEGKNNEQFNEARELPKLDKDNIIFVPLYAYGGFLSGYANKIFMDSLERYSYPGIIGEHYMFEVQGDSMKGFVSAGDRVIARPEERLEWMVKNRVYVLQTIDGILIKFFDHIKGEYAMFKSANKDYSDVKIPLKSLKKVYLVVRVDKDPYKVDLETLVKKLS